MRSRFVRNAVIGVSAMALVMVTLRVTGYESYVDGLLDDPPVDTLPPTQSDTLRQGETLDLLLRRAGLDGVAVLQVVKAAPMLEIGRAHV